MQMTAGCLHCSLAWQFCLHDWLTHLLLSSTMSAPEGRLNNVVCLDLTSIVTNPKLKNVNQTGFYLPVDFAVAHLVFISCVLHASHKHEQKNSIATVARFVQRHMSPGSFRSPLHVQTQPGCHTPIARAATMHAISLLPPASSVLSVYTHTAKSLAQLTAFTLACLRHLAEIRDVARDIVLITHLISNCCEVFADKQHVSCHDKKKFAGLQCGGVMDCC